MPPTLQTCCSVFAKLCAPETGEKASNNNPHLPDAPARALGRKSHQYFRLLSPSDVLFIVKSGTALTTPALNLTLRDDARCGVSSPEPGRLWRWPWLYPHIIPHATSKRGGARYKEGVKAAAAAWSCANSERRAGAAILLFRDLFFWMQAMLAAVLISVSYRSVDTPRHLLHVNIDMRNGCYLL